MCRARRNGSALAWIVAPIGARVQVYAGCRSADDRYAVPQVSWCRRRTRAHHGRIMVFSSNAGLTMAADGRMLHSGVWTVAVILLLADLQPGRRDAEARASALDCQEILRWDSIDPHAKPKPATASFSSPGMRNPDSLASWLRRVDLALKTRLGRRCWSIVGSVFWGYSRSGRGPFLLTTSPSPDFSTLDPDDKIVCKLPEPRERLGLDSQACREIADAPRLAKKDPTYRRSTNLL